jgi:septal ring factor EnvC (AmiA/AmiB activator)
MSEKLSSKTVDEKIQSIEKVFKEQEEFIVSALPKDVDELKLRGLLFFLLACKVGLKSSTILEKSFEMLEKEIDNLSKKLKEITKERDELLESIAKEKGKNHDGGDIQ